MVCVRSGITAGVHGVVTRGRAAENGGVVPERSMGTTLYRYLKSRFRTGVVRRRKTGFGGLVSGDVVL